MNATNAPTMSSSLLMIKSDRGNQKGCWFSTLNGMDADIKIFRNLNAEEFPCLDLIVLVAGPMQLGIELVHQT